MPPKRKRPPGQRELSTRPRAPPSLSGDDNDDTAGGGSDPADEPPPFFNVSFTAHRVSPLFVGEEHLTPQRLETISRRLRDTLVGDVVRGVRVGLDGDDTSLGRAGSLELVTIRWFDAGALAGDPRDDEENDPQRRGLCFEMRYENALCTALLLPRTLGTNDNDGNDHSITRGPFQSTADSLGMPTTFDEPTERQSPQFVHLPLLLTRMPSQLKSFVVDFICRTFDCRIAPLSLGTRSIVTAWERWIEDVGSPSRGPLAKDLVFTLAFYLSPAEMTDAAGAEGTDTQKMGIRSMDFIIPADDVGRFVQAGAASRGRDDTHPSEDQAWKTDPRKRSELSGGSAEEGWLWMQPGGGNNDESERTRAAPELPFTRALASYLDSHLALNLFHPGVRVIRIACGGFALAENRLKVFGLSLNDENQTEATTAVRRLLAGLVDKATI